MTNKEFILLIKRSGYDPISYSNPYTKNCVGIECEDGESAALYVSLILYFFVLDNPSNFPSSNFSKFKKLTSALGSAQTDFINNKQFVYWPNIGY